MSQMCRVRHKRDEKSKLCCLLLRLEWEMLTCRLWEQSWPTWHGAGSSLSHPWISRETSAASLLLVLSLQRGTDVSLTDVPKASVAVL